MGDELARALAASVFILAMASIYVLRGPLGKALADRLAGRTGVAASAEAERLRVEMEQLRQRLGEVEERLDFTERLLAKQRDADRIAPPR